MRIGRAVGARTHEHASDDGFSLIEVVVALTLTVLVMTTTAGFFIKALSASRLMQQRQSASAVAELAMERMRAKPVAALAAGYSEVKVGTDGSVATSTTDPAYRVSNTNYRVTSTVTLCYMQPTNVCNSTSSPSLMFHMKVDVNWTPGPGAKCHGPGGDCEYSVTTLRDAATSSDAVTGLKEVPQP